MALTLDDYQLRSLRLRANGLAAGGIGGDVAGVVQRVCGLQGQERAAVELGLQARSARARQGALVRADVVRALDEDGSVVRTWAMRGTIHMLAAEDVGWIVRLLGPVFIPKGRRRRRQLGLDEEMCDRATAAMERVLGKEGPLTRAELLGRLAAEGFPVEGQAGYHLIARAGLQGVVCFGPDRAGEQTFARTEDWLGPVAVKWEEEEALAELLRRYLRAFGPASVHDFARWSGLGVREARRGKKLNEGRLVEVDSQVGERLLMLPEQEAWLEEDEEEPSARLLPAYDSFLLGYTNRDLIVPEAHAREVHPGGGVLRATVLVNGIAVGNWRACRGPHRGSDSGSQDVELTLWEPLPGAKMEAVEREVGLMRRYLNG